MILFVANLPSIIAITGVGEFSITRSDYARAVRDLVFSKVAKGGGRTNPLNYLRQSANHLALGECHSPAND
jgi:hypothetical protein